MASLSTSIPEQIYLYGDIQTLGYRLAQYRADLAIAQSNAEAGIAPVKKAIGSIPDSIITTCDELINQIETAVIPAELLPDYSAGLIPLSDYIDEETLPFYADVVQIKFAMYSILATLQVVQDSITDPAGSATDPGQGVALRLDSDQYDAPADGSIYPVNTIETKYSYYTIRQGDTIPGIASTIFPDRNYLRIDSILRLNNLTADDINSGAAVGLTIRYPIQSGAITGNTLSMIYETPPTIFSQTNLEKYLYGCDLQVIDGLIVVNANGDRAVVCGKDLVAQTVQLRFSRMEGELNPMHPEDGLRIRLGDSTALLVIRLDQIFADMSLKAMLDPVVNSAQVDVRKMRIEGDVLFVVISLFLIGDETLTVETRVPT